MKFKLILYGTMIITNIHESICVIMAYTLDTRLIVQQLTWKCDNIVIVARELLAILVIFSAKLPMGR